MAIPVHELIVWMKAEHHRYCQILEDFVSQFVPLEKIKRPEFRIWLRPSNWAGKYTVRQHSCIIAIPFAYLDGTDNLRETIAHEACHAYQRLLGGNKWHNEMFYFLLRHVCKMPGANRCHTMCTRKAKSIAKILCLSLADDAHVQSYVFKKQIKSTK